jgi:hypothetical protein
LIGAEDIPAAVNTGTNAKMAAEDGGIRILSACPSRRDSFDRKTSTRIEILRVRSSSEAWDTPHHSLSNMIGHKNAIVTIMA